MSEGLPFTSARTSDGRRVELIDALGTPGETRFYRGRLSGAEGSGFSKIVAIKLVEEDAADRTELAQRNKDEARLLALLKHRAIVAVDDLLQISGRWAVTMEFVDGGALTKRGPLPPRVVAELALELASALAVAHEARDPATGQPLGLVHRTVQPSNIRVTPTGAARLVGFGFARARFAGREAKSGYLAFDQASFLAPERLLGQDTAAGDVYGLAASLASALLGDKIRALSPVVASHAAGLGELRRRLAETLPGPAGEELLDHLVAALAYTPESRPAARTLELSLQSLPARLGGEGLKEWAPSHVRSFPKPPRPSIAPSEPPRATTPAPPRRPAERAPTPPPPRKLATKTTAPARSSSGRTLALVALAVLALLCVVGGVLLLALGFRMAAG
jgi:serine/threonine-protein kinase